VPIFADYRPVPPELLEPASPRVADSDAPTIDRSWLAILSNWRLVVADLMDAGIDLWDPAVRARPWPGIRTKIFSLLEPGSASRLRAALTRR
jgi:hypothetical protein